MPDNPTINQVPSNGERRCRAITHPLQVDEESFYFNIISIEGIDGVPCWYLHRESN